jgi:hypothetical protein
MYGVRLTGLVTNSNTGVTIIPRPDDALAWTAPQGYPVTMSVSDRRRRTAPRREVNMLMRALTIRVTPNGMIVKPHGLPDEEQAVVDRLCEGGL